MNKYKKFITFSLLVCSVFLNLFLFSKLNHRLVESTGMIRINELKFKSIAIENSEKRSFSLLSFVNINQEMLKFDSNLLLSLALNVANSEEVYTYCEQSEDEVYDRLG